MKNQGLEGIGFVGYKVFRVQGSVDECTIPNGMDEK